jgi:hypothetical protein
VFLLDFLALNHIININEYNTFNTIEGPGISFQTVLDLK